MGRVSTKTVGPFPGPPKGRGFSIAIFLCRGTFWVGSFLPLEGDTMTETFAPQGCSGDWPNGSRGRDLFRWRFSEQTS